MLSITREYRNQIATVAQLHGQIAQIVAAILVVGVCRLSESEIAETLELARWLLREGLASPALRDDNGEVGDLVPLPRIK